jgi:hypothetical protein
MYTADKMVMEASDYFIKIIVGFYRFNLIANIHRTQAPNVKLKRTKAILVTGLGGL